MFFLGDLLFDIILLIRSCERSHNITLKSVAEACCKKVKFRCSYIWGNDVINTKKEALECWVKNKKIENRQKFYPQVFGLGIVVFFWISSQHQR